MRSMRRRLLPAAVLVFVVLGATGPSAGQGTDKKFEDFDKAVKGAKELEGLFRLHLKDENLYAEIKPDQFDRPFLCPIAIARGLGLGGFTLNFDEQWVLIFKRVGDKVHVIRRNVRFQAKAGSPTAKAVETTYTDSVLLALHIVSINANRQSVLINFNDIFMTDFAGLNIGHFDVNRSTWHKVKAFPRNIEIEVAATFAGGHFSDDSVIDDRGKTVVIHYGLMQLPESGFQPRLADDRVGHFLSVVKDFSSESPDTAFLRYVNRWRLERVEPVDPKNPNKLSAPKKKIVFWIEKSVPDEYRAAVREGILEWNKAFEKIGFRDAIEVRQQENEEFDPEDVTYNTFRWIATDAGFAMGPSRANPLTGEILDADIVFDASMVRFWRKEQKIFGSAAEPASLIQAGRQGLGMLSPLPGNDNDPAGWLETPQAEKARRSAGMLAARRGLCQCGAHMKYELGMAAMALAARDLLKPGEKLPEDLILQAIKEVTMHEVGHTLGLRHNFKASTMLKNEQLHDLGVTRKQGLVGSVMDYAPTNIAPRGVKQGDYFTTTIGPYDYWAIEYAYRPLSGGTEGELDKLQEIAKKIAETGHDYATDEDLFTSADPLVNMWDLGNDPMKFAQDRILLAEELLKGLSERVVEKGEGYQRLRQAFGILLGQFGNGAHLVANYVGGEMMHRDHREDPNGRDPFVPVRADKQREALKFLAKHIFTDRTFQFSPALLRRLAADRWLHWGNERAMFTSVDFPLNERVLNIQRVALFQLLNPSTLARIQNNALKTDNAEKALEIAEVFRSLTEAIWSDLPPEHAREARKGENTSVIRRNLQREFLRELTSMVIGGRQPVPPDARSLARMHLREIARRIEMHVGDKQVVLSDACRAHLIESQERINKALNAAVQVNEP